MSTTLRHLGLDVHAEAITAALAEPDGSSGSRPISAGHCSVTWTGSLYKAAAIMVWLLLTLTTTTFVVLRALRKPTSPAQRLSRMVQNMPDFRIDSSEDGYGQVLVPCSEWSTDLQRLMEQRGIRAVRLSTAMGWAGGCIKFLASIPNLASVEIYDWKLHDASILGSLHTLRLVGLECDLRTPIDFSGLNELEVLRARWTPALTSLFACVGLRTLNVTHWPSADVGRLASMMRLVTLALTSNKLRSLAGVEDLTAVRSLDLHQCPWLEGITELSSLRGIRQLSLSSCRRVRDVSPVAVLTDLREFILDDCGEVLGLRALVACQQLEKLSFVGSTTIADGDLSFIRQLGKLRTLRFTPRRHYNETLPQLRPLLRTSE